MKIYPDPMQLLEIFQQTLPPQVLNLVAEKMASEFKADQEKVKASEVEQLD